MLLILLQSQSAAVTHDTSGALTGQGASVTGDANRTRVFDTSGALTGPGAEVAGSSTRTAPTVEVSWLEIEAGVATHDANGALTGPGSTLSGAATRFRAFGTSGTLLGPGSTLSGSATRFRAFGTSGVLIGPGATVTGDANRSGSAVTHDTSGALVGPGSTLSGQAARPVVGGGGYDDDKPKPKRRRFIVERDGKLLVYASQAAALRALDEAAPEPEAPEAPEAPEVVAETPAAEEVVDLPTVQAYAEVAGRIEDYNAAWNSRHYEALLALFEQLRDEEDVEMLLLTL